jgi:hypothetical protein
MIELLKLLIGLVAGGVVVLFVALVAGYIREYFRGS